MRRFIISLPMIIMIFGATGIAYVLQIGISESVAYQKKEGVWAGVCQGREVVENQGRVHLTVMCRGDEVTVSNAKIIVAWLNVGEDPICTQFKLWNSQDFSWKCERQEDEETLSDN